MEESVALDSSKQKQFVKSVRGIKKLLKKGSKKLKESGQTKEKKSNADQKPEDKTVPTKEKEEKLNKKIKKVKKDKKRAKRGLVYLSHIPHGFYEHQMTEYFKQFGVVTNARVIRSKRTGNSKGFAFVEFKEPSVAEIVAETMNNYLMGKRLIKAVYIPPEKQKVGALRKNWNYQNNPASEHRLKMKKALNADKSDKEELAAAKKLLNTLTKTKEKLKGLDIDYDFFVPVDIPEDLKEMVEKSREDIKDKEIVVVDSKKKIKTEEKVAKSEQKKIKTEPTENKSNIVKNENNKTKKVKQDKPDIKSNDKQPLEENKNQTQKVQENKVDNKRQQLKQKKLDEASIKGPENFININESNDDSDGSIDFDSDEFEKMMENDEDELSSGDDDEENDESDESSEEVVQKLDVKDKTKSNVPSKAKNVPKATIKTKQGKGISKNKPEKRKTVSSAPVTTKKAKFEKQNKKTLNKVIKKRK